MAKLARPKREATRRILLAGAALACAVLAVGLAADAKKSGVGSAGTERITPPAMRNPKAWIG